VAMYSLFNTYCLASEW